MMDKYELQKEVAEDASRTATMSVIAKQLTPMLEADDGSRVLDVMTEVDDADDVVTREEDGLLVKTDELDVKTLEEVLRLSLTLVLEIGELKVDGLKVSELKVGELKVSTLKIGFVRVREVWSLALLEDRDILRVDEVKNCIIPSTSLPSACWT
jgi:hypothetical protein